MANVDVSVRMRGHIRKSITDIYHSNNSFSNLSQIERETIKLKIKTLTERLQNMNETIHIGKANDLEFNWEEELRKCSEYDDKICTCLAMLDCIAGSPNPGNTSGLLKSSGSFTKILWS